MNDETPTGDEQPSPQEHDYDTEPRVFPHRAHSHYPDEKAEKYERETDEEIERLREKVILAYEWLRWHLRCLESRKWNGVTAFGTVLAVIAASVYATIAAHQLKEMRRTNDDIEKQFQAQQRAWVGNGEIRVKKTAFLIYPDNPIQHKTQIDLVVDVPIKNVGISPAFNVVTWMTPIVSEQVGGFPAVESKMEYTCGTPEENAKRVGQVLFPNSPDTLVEWPMSMGTTLTQANQVRRIWVDICISYWSSTVDKQVHHTKIWLASWPIDGKPIEIGRITQPRIIYYSLPITGWVVVKTEAD